MLLLVCLALYNILFGGTVSLIYPFLGQWFMAVAIFCDFNILFSLGFSYTCHIVFLYFQLYIIFIISYNLLLLIIVITSIIIMAITNNFTISIIIVFITTQASSTFILLEMN